MAVVRSTYKYKYKVYIDVVIVFSSGSMDRVSDFWDRSSKFIINSIIVAIAVIIAKYSNTTAYR